MALLLSRYVLDVMRFVVTFSLVKAVQNVFPDTHPEEKMPIQR